MKNSVDTLL